MLLTVDTPDCGQYLVHDVDGHLIPCVVFFDTETQEIEVSISVMKSAEERNKVVQMMQSVTQDDGSVESKPIFVKFTLPGSYATKNGERIV